MKYSVLLSILAIACIGLASAQTTTRIVDSAGATGITVDLTLSTISTSGDTLSAKLKITPGTFSTTANDGIAGICCISAATDTTDKAAQLMKGNCFGFYAKCATACANSASGQAPADTKLVQGVVVGTAWTPGVNMAPATATAMTQATAGTLESPAYSLNPGEWFALGLPNGLNSKVSMECKWHTFKASPEDVAAAITNVNTAFTLTKTTEFAGTGTAICSTTTSKSGSMIQHVISAAMLSAVLAYLV